MAGFHTHITVSSLCGAGYGWWGATQLGLPMPACMLAGGLCSISGMLPDLDSDSGVPARETISFAAAIVPMVAFYRLNQHGISVEQMVLAGAPMYLFIRFGLGTLLKKFTVHRGMFHSIPALVIATMIAFLICDTGLTTVRFFKAGGVALGFFSHLLLDEIWSVNLRGKGPVLKRSFGTAIKFFGPTAGGNSACYGMLILISLLVVQDTQQTTLTHPAQRITIPTNDDPPPIRRAHRDIIYE
jgi:membrane-bound metal-dependent hydrolase YbcI (DUF457 family)